MSEESAGRRRAVVLGKGTLAVRVAGWFLASDDYTLERIVPVVPEPAWTESLIGWADANGVPYVATGDYRDLELAAPIDLAISIFYDRIIGADFIASCGRILNLHNSPLPRYRGVSPINWALKNGELEHGITIHEITPGIDDGPIVAQASYSIYPELDEVIEVYERALEYGWLLFRQTMPLLDRIRPRVQDESEATYYSREDNAALGERSGFRR